MNITEIEAVNPVLRDKITVLAPAKELLKSQYGVTSYLKWCEREVRRIGNCTLFQSAGLCCVIPNDPSRLLPVEGVA